MIFQFEQFRRFLEHLKSLAAVLPLRDWKGENAIILRHDIDFDIAMAHRVAEIEKDVGVLSTHYILTTCPTYNPLEKVNRDLLREMCDWGFEIGLHFDPPLYSDEEMTDAVDREIDVLRFATGTDVRSISLHNPSVHGQFPLFDGYRNAYDPEIFDNECYLSDSRMQFRGKDPFEFVRVVSEKPVQVLLHPLHFTRDGDGYDGIFAEGIRNHVEKIHQTFQVNETYMEHVGGDLFGVVQDQVCCPRTP